MGSHLNDEGFLKRFKKRLDARAQQELSARVAGYRAEGLLPAVPKAMVSLKDEFERLIAELVSGGMGRQQAVGQVFERYPRLRQEMIDEANRARSRR